MDTIDIKTYMQSVGREARAASRLMARAETAAKNQALTAMAAAIQRDQQKLLAANAQDVADAKAKGLDDALLDRLTLTAKGVASMAEGLLQIAALADPIGEISELNYRPSGIQVGKMRVPLGVVGNILDYAGRFPLREMGVMLVSDLHRNIGKAIFTTPQFALWANQVTDIMLYE